MTTKYESDRSYQERLAEAPGVGDYWAEDIGEASGEELDNFGTLLGVPRGEDPFPS